MNLFIVDAFTNQMFGGNQAGVVLLGPEEPFPDAPVMLKIAAELKHSETAFVKPTDPHTFQFRYFTPEGEVDLCGHATVSAFTVLRDERKLDTGHYLADTLAGSLDVLVEQDQIWMEMAQAKLLRYLSPEESTEVYQAYGIGLQDLPNTLRPCIVSSGLPDILLPVGSREILDGAVSNRDEIIRISKKHQVTGVHMYCRALSPEVTAYCRNFAPLYGIDEEAATGTSNGALTYYLFENGLIRAGDHNVFIQGTRMGKPSVIRSRMENGRIYIGGEAVISVSGHILL